MRIIIVAVGRDYGNPLTNQPLEDGPIYANPATILEVSPPSPLDGYVRLDGVPVGKIVQVLIDHEDEKAPPA